MCKYRKTWHALVEVLAKGFINISYTPTTNNIYPISVLLSESKRIFLAAVKSVSY